MFLSAAAFATANLVGGAWANDRSAVPMSGDAVPQCKTVPFRVGVEVSTLERNVHVDEPHAVVSRQEMATYVANALRQTDLFAGVHVGAQAELELALVIEILALDYRSDPAQPHLRLEADVELNWRDGRERYWRSRYVAESAYAEQAPGRHGRFTLNLRMATARLVRELTRDLNGFFLAEGLAKVSFRRDIPAGTPLVPVAIVEVGKSSKAALLRRLKALVAASLCLEPVGVRSTPAHLDREGLLARRFGIHLGDTTSSLACRSSVARRRNVRRGDRPRSRPRARQRSLGRCTGRPGAGRTPARDHRRRTHGGAPRLGELPEAGVRARGPES